MSNSIYRNNEGYYDPTAGTAITNIDRERKIEEESICYKFENDLSELLKNNGYTFSGRLIVKTICGFTYKIDNRMFLRASRIVNKGFTDIDSIMIHIHKLKNYYRLDFIGFIKLYSKKTKQNYEFDFKKEIN